MQYAEYGVAFVQHSAICISIRERILNPMGNQQCPDQLMLANSGYMVQSFVYTIRVTHDTT